MGLGVAGKTYDVRYVGGYGDWCCRQRLACCWGLVQEYALLIWFTILRAGVPLSGFDSGGVRSRTYYDEMKEWFYLCRIGNAPMTCLWMYGSCVVATGGFWMAFEYGEIKKAAFVSGLYFFFLKLRLHSVNLSHYF